MSMKSLLCAYNAHPEAERFFVVINANSADQIRSKFPEIDVLDEPPSDISAQHIKAVFDRGGIDLDDEPRGSLKKIVAEIQRWSLPPTENNAPKASPRPVPDKHGYIWHGSMGIKFSNDGSVHVKTKSA